MVREERFDSGNSNFIRNCGNVGAQGWRKTAMAIPSITAFTYIEKEEWVMIMGNQAMAGNKTMTFLQHNTCYSAHNYISRFISRFSQLSWIADGEISIFITLQKRSYNIPGKATVILSWLHCICAVVIGVMVLRSHSYTSQRNREQGSAVNHDVNPRFFIAPSNYNWLSTEHQCSASARTT